MLTGRINSNNRDEILRGRRTHLKRARRKIWRDVEEEEEEEEEGGGGGGGGGGGETESPKRKKVFLQSRYPSYFFSNQYNICIDFQSKTNFN